MFFALAIPEDLEPANLTAMLRVHKLYDNVEVQSVDFSALDSHNRARLTRLSLGYSVDGEQMYSDQLLLKMQKEGAEQRDLLYAQKEVVFYSALQKVNEVIPIPQCFDAAYFPELGRFYLLLQDVSATHCPLKDRDLSPQYAQCQQAIMSLARFHAHFWNLTQLPQALASERMNEHQLAEKIEELQNICSRFQDFIGDRLSSERHSVLSLLCASLPKILQRHMYNTTLIHGVLSFSFFLYPQMEENGAVILDWTEWRIDAASCDLATLIAMHWYPERRARFERVLLQLYHEELVKCGVSGYSWEQCWHDYRLAVLRTVLVPLEQWANGEWSGSWWHHLERVFLAYEDLACVELLL